MLSGTAFSLAIRKITPFCDFQSEIFRQWPDDRSVMGKSIFILCFEEIFCFSPIPGIFSCLEVEKQISVDPQPKETSQCTWKASYSPEKPQEISAFCPEIWRDETSNRYETFRCSKEQETLIPSLGVIPFKCTLAYKITSCKSIYACAKTLH